MNIKKSLLIFAAVVAVAAGSYKIYDVYFNYRLMAISENKVYKSGVIPPDELEEFVRKHNIKSIVDLRGPVTVDTINNPETSDEIRGEKEAAAKIKGLNYYNIPSRQVPNEDNLRRFYAVMDDKENYPVLIHCHHGIGRAMMYSSLYRIEYENFSNEEARDGAAFPVMFSSFDDGTSKGEFLKSYVPRSMTEKY